MYPDLKDFVETIWGPVERPGELASRVGELLPNPRYLFITRRDKIRQAVSYWRALQTEQWSSLEPQPAVFQGSYQFERISSLRAYIAQCERAWQGYFNDSRITPYLVVYEDFVVSYRETTAGVLAYLGLAATRSPLEPRMKRQADSLSEAWAERFQREEAERRSLMNSGVLGEYPDGEC